MRPRLLSSQNQQPSTSFGRIQGPISSRKALVARSLPDDVRRREMRELAKMLPDPVDDIFDTSDPEYGFGFDGTDPENAEGRSIEGMKPDENNNWSTGYFMGPNAPDPRFGTVRIGPEKPPSQYGFPSRANLRPTVPPPSSATFERPIEDHYLLRPEQLKPEARHTYTESVAELRFHVEVKRRQLKGQLMAKARSMHSSQMHRSWNRYRACMRFAELLTVIEEQDNLVDLENLSPVPSWVRATLAFEKDLDAWNESELGQVQLAEAKQVKEWSEQEAEERDRDDVSDARAEEELEDAIDKQGTAFGAFDAMFSRELNADAILSADVTLPGASTEDLDQLSESFLKDIMMGATGEDEMDDNLFAKQPVPKL